MCAVRAELVRSVPQRPEVTHALGELYTLVTHVLAERHAYLHTSYYSTLPGRIEAAVASLDVLFMTMSQLHKVNGSKVPWMQYLRSDCNKVLCLDENEDETLPAVLAAAWPLDILNLYGDWAQGPAVDERYQWDCGSWLEGAAAKDAMRITTLTEEHRYGKTVAIMLRAVLPKSCKHVWSSELAPSTAIVPHLFKHGLD